MSFWGNGTWSADLDSEARGLAAAGGVLYVSTSKGTVYAFGEGDGESKSHVARNGESPYAKDDWTAKYEQAAEEILASTGVRQGFCLVLGADEGRLACERQSKTGAPFPKVDEIFIRRSN